MHPPLKNTWFDDIMKWKKKDMKDSGMMDTVNHVDWENLTSEEKRRELYDRQVATLATFLEHGAITQDQHDKSLHDLTVKMGYGEE